MKEEKPEIGKITNRLYKIGERIKQLHQAKENHRDKNPGLEFGDHVCENATPGAMNRSNYVRSVRNYSAGSKK